MASRSNRKDVTHSKHTSLKTVIHYKQVNFVEKKEAKYEFTQTS